jgi:hypothetical protein
VVLGPHGGASTLPRGVSVAEFDRIYPIRWSSDLKYQVPFLDPQSTRHPYSLSYLRKLLYSLGQRYASHSEALDHLIDSPAGLLLEVFRAIGMHDDYLSRTLPLIGSPRLGRWSGFADDDWFRRHEGVSETALHGFFEPPATRG